MKRLRSSEARHRALPLAALLAAVFAVKLVVLLQLHNHPLLQPGGELDAGYYVRLAQRVAAGDWRLGPGAYFVSPLYVYIVGTLFAVSGGSVFFVRLVQIALGAAGVALLFATTRHWFGARAAWIAAALAGLTGTFTFYEVLILQAALDPFLTALDLYVLTRALATRRAAWLVATGVAVGAHALNRPNILAWGLLLVALLVLARRDGTWRSRTGQAGALAAGLAIALAPPAARTYLVAGELSPLPSHGGLNFYIGNNPDADGTYHSVGGITPDITGQAQDARRVAERARNRPLSDAEVSDYFYGLARDWIVAHPATAMRLFARKLIYLCNAAWLTLNYSYPYYAHDERTWLALLLAGPWCLMPLGLVGLLAGAWSETRDMTASGSPQGSAYWIWCSFVPVYALSVAAFFVASRYRLPLLVPLCAGSGAAVEGLRSRWRIVSIRTVAGPLAALAAVAVVANWPVHLDDGRSEERTRMAVWLVGAGRSEEAEALVRRARPEHPQPGLLHFRVGGAYAAVGRLSDAASHYQEALRLDPDQPEVSLALGRVLDSRGDPAGAVPHLERAFSRGLRPWISGELLARALTATGRPGEAAQTLALIDPAAGGDVKALAALGALALQVKRADLAERFLRECLRRAPDDSAGHQRLGLALASLGRVAEAAAELEAAVRLDPADPVAQLNLAVVYAQQGRVAEARARAEEALRLRPDYDHARRLLAALGR